MASATTTRGGISKNEKSKLTISMKALKRNGQPGTNRLGDSAWIAEEQASFNVPIRVNGKQSSLGGKTSWTFGEANQFSRHLIKSITLEIYCPGVVHAKGPESGQHVARVQNFGYLVLKQAKMLGYPCVMTADFIEKVIRDEIDVISEDIGRYREEDENNAIEKAIISTERKLYTIVLNFPFSDADGSEFPAFLYANGFNIDFEWNSVDMLFETTDNSCPKNIETDAAFKPTDLTVNVVFSTIELPPERITSLLEEVSSRYGLEHKLLFRLPVGSAVYKPGSKGNLEPCDGTLMSQLEANAIQSNSRKSRPKIQIPIKLATEHRGIIITYLSDLNRASHRFCNFSSLEQLEGEFDGETNQPIVHEVDPIVSISLVIDNIRDENSFIPAARARGDQFYRFTTNKTAPNGAFIYGISHTKNWFDASRTTGVRDFTNKTVAIELELREGLESGKFKVWAVMEEVVSFRRAKNNGPEILSVIMNPSTSS